VQQQRQLMLAWLQQPQQELVPGAACFGCHTAHLQLLQTLLVLER
jgi:hypothetical protein